MIVNKVCGLKNWHAFTDLTVLTEKDLEPALLARKITGKLDQQNRVPAVQLDGAEQTAAYLTQLA